MRDAYDIAGRLKFLEECGPLVRGLGAYAHLQRNTPQTAAEEPELLAADITAFCFPANPLNRTFPVIRAITSRAPRAPE